MRQAYFLRLIIIGAILIQSITLSAQTNYGNHSCLYGRVLFNAEGAPFVTLQLKGTNYGTSTDAEGNFMLEGLPAGSHVLMIQGIGYKVAEKKVEIGEGVTLE